MSIAKFFDGNGWRKVLVNSSLLVKLGKYNQKNAESEKKLWPAGGIIVPTFG